MLFFSTGIINNVFAQVDDLNKKEVFLQDQAEQRAQKLFLQVKCLVCQGQVIESSNTQIAFDLRKLIRDKIIAGLSDEEIKIYLIENYGPEILMNPPLNKETLILWALPAILLFIGCVLLILRFRKIF